MDPHIVRIVDATENSMKKSEEAVGIKSTENKASVWCLDVDAQRMACWLYPVEYVEIQIVRQKISNRSRLVNVDNSLTVDDEISDGPNPAFALLYAFASSSTWLFLQENLSKFYESIVNMSRPLYKKIK